MRPKDHSVAKRLNSGLSRYDQEERPLLGIIEPAPRAAFIEQLLESTRRVRYVRLLDSLKLSQRRGDPSDNLFDPLKAAVLKKRQGDIDEAFWLVFLFVHFGRHARGGWRYPREVYGRLGDGVLWDWRTVSANPGAFRRWLAANETALQRDGVPGGFGNHRKYQSLDAYGPRGTGAAVESYVEWVAPPRTHEEMFSAAYGDAEGDPRRAFDILYRSLDSVVTFGRLARFDYLAAVGNLDLAPVEPGSVYIQQGTGPLRGARLLFGGSEQARPKPAELESWLVALERRLGVGMQVLEDALCNWQKSPIVFRPFRG